MFPKYFKFEEVTLITQLDNFDNLNNQHLRNYELAILDSLFDQRFSLFRKFTGFKNFLEIAENHMLAESIKYITPNFLQHFNIEGISDENIFFYRINLAGL